MVPPAKRKQKENKKKNFSVKKKEKRVALARLPAQMDHELAAINDAELALIKRAIEEKLEKKLDGSESAGTVAAEQAIVSRGLLTLGDVKLALLPRIGRGVDGVFSAYVRSLRADGVGTVEPVSGVDAVEADVRKAARALLAALGYCELSGKYGAAKRCSAVATALADYFYYIWRRSARYGHDPDARAPYAQSWNLYLFDGATYDRPAHSVLSFSAKQQLRSVLRFLHLVPDEVRTKWGALARDMGHGPPRADASVRLLINIDETEPDANAVTKAIKKMHSKLKDARLLVRDGRMSPRDLERAMDAGAYIGMKNGVLDLRLRRFMPTGTVPRSVLVSFCSHLSYDHEMDEVASDRMEEVHYRAQIHELYRTLFADDYNDPDDPSLAAMWSFMGSLLRRGPKPPCIFLGTDRGDNGKSLFTNLMHATLGDYSIARICIPKFDGHRLVCTSTMGEDLRDVPLDYESGNVQAIFHASPYEMSAAQRTGAFGTPWHGRIVRFGSVFSEEADTARRLYPRDPDLHNKIRKWGQVHFTMMLEASARAVFPPKN
jgi:hypothetical protein